MKNFLIIFLRHVAKILVLFKFWSRKLQFSVDRYTFVSPPNFRPQSNLFNTQEFGT